ncbi:MAG: hypothetical protein RL291_920 [Pseudomonadota bacterium]
MVFEGIGVAILATVTVALLLQDRHVLLRQVRRTRGVVIDHRASRDEGDEQFSATVSFVDHAGRTVTFDDLIAYPTKRPAIGQEVDVIYDVRDSSKARIPRPTLRLGIYAVLAATMAILLLKMSGRLA